MARLLKITTEVYLPDATAADWTLTYPANSPYLVAGKLAGGVVGGALEAVPNKAGWWRWPQTQTVFGGELGDGEPPLVTVRVTPKMPAGKKVLPIPYQGHPREIVAGEGSWDLSRIRIGGGGPILATEAQVAKLGDLDAKSARADADHARSVQQGTDTAQSKAAADAAIAGLQALKATLVTSVVVVTKPDGSRVLQVTGPGPLTPPANVAAKITGKGARVSWAAGDANAQSHRIETANGGAYTTAATLAMPALSADLIIPVDEARTARVIAVDDIGDSLPAPTPVLTLPARYPAGALALWTLEEGGGTTSSDLVSNRALTLTTYNSISPGWESGGGIALPGGGYLSAGQFGQIPADGLHLIAVVKIPTFAPGDAAAQIVFGRWLGEYVVTLDQSKSDNTGRLALVSKAPDATISSVQTPAGKNVQDNLWHLIRAVLTPTRIELWVDGVMQAGYGLAAGKVPPTPTATPLTLGNYGTPNASLKPRLAYNSFMAYPPAAMTPAAVAQILATEKLRLTQIGRTAAW